MPAADDFSNLQVVSAGWAQYPNVIPEQNAAHAHFARNDATLIVKFENRIIRLPFIQLNGSMPPIAAHAKDMWLGGSPIRRALDSGIEA
jgi:hypothetical protein